MEMFVFAALVTWLLGGSFGRDAMSALSGRSLPSHEWRMQRDQHRQAASAQRHQRRLTRRPGPARSYAADTWGHAWTRAARSRQRHWSNAAQRRQARDEHIDPIREQHHREKAKAHAERYAQKLAAKRDGTYRGPARRAAAWTTSKAHQARQSRRDAVAEETLTEDEQYALGDLEAAAKARGDKPGVRQRIRDAWGGTSPGQRQAARGEVQRRRNGNGVDPEPEASDDPDDLEVVIAREDHLEDAGVLDGDDRRTCSTCQAWATDEHLASQQHQDQTGVRVDPDPDTEPSDTGQPDTDQAAGYWAYHDENDGTTTPIAGPFDTFDEAHDYCRDDDDLYAAKHTQPDRWDTDDWPEPATATTDQEENTMTAPTGEAVGLEQAEAQLDQFHTAYADGATAFEPFAASLESQEVGPGVTQPLVQAQEAARQIVTYIEQAQDALSGSRNVADAYSGAPDAGNKEFVTH